MPTPASRTSTRASPAGLDPRQLVALDDGELHALIDATYKAPQIAPGLLASIEGTLERALQSVELDVRSWP